MENVLQPRQSLFYNIYSEITWYIADGQQSCLNKHPEPRGMEIENQNNQLYSDVFRLVEEARLHVAVVANQTLTLLYWKIGERVNNDLLEGKRAQYGKQIVSELATHLQQAFGSFEFKLDQNLQLKNLTADPKSKV